MSRAGPSRTVLAHVVLSLVNILTIFGFVFRNRWSECPSSEPGLYSPALQVIHHEFQVMNLDPGHFANDNPFVGDPRVEYDEAWNALLENIHIWVTPSEFGKLYPQINRTSLRLPNGAYVIRFGVYHELHCLKWIRKWIHRDHYWPDLVGDALHERKWHIEHCLEHFRLATMQRAPLNPATLRFSTSDLSNKLEVDGAHTVRSVNWDRLQEWTGQRRVDLGAIDWSTLVEG